MRAMTGTGSRRKASQQRWTSVMKPRAPSRSSAAISPISAPPTKACPPAPERTTSRNPGSPASASAAATSRSSRARPRLLRFARLSIVTCATRPPSASSCRATTIPFALTAAPLVRSAISPRLCICAGARQAKPPRLASKRPRRPLCPVLAPALRSLGLAENALGVVEQRCGLVGMALLMHDAGKGQLGIGKPRRPAAGAAHQHPDRKAQGRGGGVQSLQAEIGQPQLVKIIGDIGVGRAEPGLVEQRRLLDRRQGCGIAFLPDIDHAERGKIARDRLAVGPLPAIERKRPAQCARALGKMLLGGERAGKGAQRRAVLRPLPPALAGGQGDGLGRPFLRLPRRAARAGDAGKTA